MTYLDISGVVKPFIDDFNLFNSEFDVAELVTSHLTKLKTLKIAGTNIGELNAAKLKSIGGWAVENIC